MTRLEYGTISHNSGENRNPMDRDSGGLNIMKHALATCHGGIDGDSLHGSHTVAWSQIAHYLERVTVHLLPGSRRQAQGWARSGEIRRPILCPSTPC